MKFYNKYSLFFIKCKNYYNGYGFKLKVCDSLKGVKPMSLNKLKFDRFLRRVKSWIKGNGFRTSIVPYYIQDKNDVVIYEDRGHKNDINLIAVIYEEIKSLLKKDNK